MASQWHFVHCTIYSTLFESMEANWSSKAHAVSSIISFPVIIMILYIFSCLYNFLKSLYFLLFSRKRNFCLNCKLVKGDFLVIIWNNNPPIGNCDDIKHLSTVLLQPSMWNRTNSRERFMTLFYKNGLPWTYQAQIVW